MLRTSKKGAQDLSLPGFVDEIKKTGKRPLKKNQPVRENEWQTFTDYLSNDPFVFYPESVTSGSAELVRRFFGRKGIKSRNYCLF